MWKQEIEVETGDKSGVYSLGLSWNLETIVLYVLYENNSIIRFLFCFISSGRDFIGCDERDECSHILL